MSPLNGKVAVIVGVANAHSIAAGCAQAMYISIHSLIRMARLADLSALDGIALEAKAHWGYGAAQLAAVSTSRA